MTQPFLCRDCFELDAGLTVPSRCPRCGSPRMVAHPELARLAIAHLDCDAFYASIEKRDRPELADKPLIVGGGSRGVVTTCCYIARQSGVRSAMPMFTARRLCPEAVVIAPDMSKYVAVSRQIRSMMEALTPLVEPISIDEAFLDLAGTAALHRAPPAQVLARFARRVETDIGVTLSVGLSHNKFLAKIASDLDKPRGFAVIGAAETERFLAPRPISLIYGVGKVFAETLRKDGYHTIGQLQATSAQHLAKRYGELGVRLARLAHGDDSRPVTLDRRHKTISSETTFDRDLTGIDELSEILLEQCERLSERVKAAGLIGDTVTVKLKTAGFRLRTRAGHLMIPTQLASVLYDTGLRLLAPEIDGTRFRLLGVGLSGLLPATGNDPVDLVDPGVARKAAAERALDRVRQRFGRSAVVRGKLYKGAVPPGTATDIEESKD